MGFVCHSAGQFRVSASKKACFHVMILSLLYSFRDDKLLETLEAIVAGENISLDAPANIFIGFDSR